MKKLITFVALAAVAQSGYAFSISKGFIGVFTSGALTNYTIDAFIEIEDNGFFSGTADTNPMTLDDGDILDFSLEIYDDLGLFYTSFDLFDDLDPQASFEDQSFVGLDYFGFNFTGENLNVFYDAFAADAASGILVSFDDGFGDISTGTLNLATAVPEPGSFALLAGALALGSVSLRRRRAIIS